MDNDYIAFRRWFRANSDRFHHAQFDDKQIAYSAWLAGIECERKKWKGTLSKAKDQCDSILDETERRLRDDRLGEFHDH